MPFLKKFTELIFPLIMDIINRSVSESVMLLCLKRVNIMPILKKLGIKRKVYKIIDLYRTFHLYLNLLSN